MAPSHRSMAATRASLCSLARAAGGRPMLSNARFASTATQLPLTSLTAVSGIDGRYAKQTASLRPYFSEWALIKYRVAVELAWLEVLADHPSVKEVAPFSASAKAALADIVAKFDMAAAERVKSIEATTNHDVKAVEYYLKEVFASSSGGAELAKASEFLHFACTSEDVNNLAYAMMVKDATGKVLVPAMKSVVDACVTNAEAQASVPMLCRTHGQPATPSTMGKEWANWAARLAAATAQLKAVRILGKFNGAVGNFNAHIVAYPGLDFEGMARTLVEGRLGLAYNPYSTQIEPHDWVAQWSHGLARYNTILLDLDRDVWGYISLGYFKQRTVAGEVGSSTMPHKVNPIDFENSEGNVGLANALLEHLAAKLPVSRFQRDLSDSTVLRAMGSAAGHCMLSYSSTLRGMGKLSLDERVLAADLDSRWEVLAEPIQTVMRRHGAPTPYEQLKELTRGQGAFNADSIRAFVRKLGTSGQLPPDAVQQLLELTPASYTGEAARLAKGVRKYAQDLGL